MRRFYILLFVLSLVSLTSAGQTRRSARRTKARTTKVIKKSSRRKTAPTSSIRGLQNERQQIQRQIKEQERRLRSNEANVKDRLRNLMIINTEIEGKRRTIDTIRNDISQLNGHIKNLNGQLVVLNKELTDRKQKYVKSMRYMHRNRGLMNELMFVFSAKNFRQMYRRMRFMREYATYQRVQGEMVISKQKEVHSKHVLLTNTKHQKSHLLTKGEIERRNLEGKQTEQQTVVSSLQKEQKTIQSIIAQQRARDAALNSQIDRMIAQEIARAKARAAAEAKRKADAAAARQRAAELARKKAEAEAAARENARKIAEAKAKEEQMRREAEAASQLQRAEAEAKARQAKEERKAAERQAAADAKAHRREVAQAAKASAADNSAYSSADQRVSGNFESNRGRLPMPITGGYKIVSHFGQYNVEGLSNVRLDNKGINIMGHPGAMARSIFDGEVSGVFSDGGSAVVMVRHGSYISVYCNLSSVCVSRGQHVSTRQALGRVGAENILQFQLRRETSKLNPEAWLGR